MKYNNTLSSDSFKLLKSLHGEKVNKISITSAGLPNVQNESHHNMAFFILLQLDNKEIVIFSSLNMSKDGQEFSEIRIVYPHQFPDENELFDEHEAIDTGLGYLWTPKSFLSGRVIRDNINWTDGKNKFGMEIDIGIKLIFENVELLVMARDSSVGLLEVWIGESQEWTNNTEMYQDIYSFSSSEILCIYREEILF
mgnify:CR=1 FL=1